MFLEEYSVITPLMQIFVNFSSFFKSATPFLRFPMSSWSIFYAVNSKFPLNRTEDFRQMGKPCGNFARYRLIPGPFVNYLMANGWGRRSGILTRQVSNAICGMHGWECRFPEDKCQQFLLAVSRQALKELQRQELLEFITHKWERFA